MKYICSLCGYVYDEEEGVPDEASPPAPNSRTFPRTLSARSAAPARTNSRRNRSKNRIF